MPTKYNYLVLNKSTINFIVFNYIMYFIFIIFLSSNITSTNNLIIESKKDINIIGSNLTANNDLNLNSEEGNVNVLNAMDSEYLSYDKNKKNAFKKTITTKVDYVETALNSNLNAKNINILANKNILIQASNTESKENTNITSNIGNIEITDALLQEYHYYKKKTENRGLYKAVTNVTSSMLDLGMLAMNSMIITNPLKEILTPTIPNLAKGYVLFGDGSKEIKDNSISTTENKTETINSKTIVVGSNVNSNNNLTITSNKDATIKSSNLNIKNDLIMNAEVLNIVADKTQDITQTNNKTKRTLQVKYSYRANSTIDYVNTEIEAGSCNFNITDNINVEQKNIERYKDLIDNANTNNTSVVFKHLKEETKKWNETNRQLTDVGQIGVAAAAVVVSTVTFGTATPLAAAATAAAASTASTSVLVTGINASMNADGYIFKQLKDVSGDVIQETTSEDSLKSIAISVVVAYGAKWAFDKYGGKATLEKGKDYSVYKPDRSILEEYKKINPNYNGVIDPLSNNIGMANTTNVLEKVGTTVPPYSNKPWKLSFWKGFAKEGGFISKVSNQVGGMNSMATYIHDSWSTGTIIEKIPLMTQLTIPPATFIQYCATFPGACGVVITDTYNNNYGVSK